MSGVLIDTHCHLDAAEFEPDRAQVLCDAQASGVSSIVVPAVEPSNFVAVRDCCSRYSGCFPAYGIHPLYVEQVGEEALAGMRAFIRTELAGSLPPVAIGEIGLDRYEPGIDMERQEIFFVEQLRMAGDFDLPVLLHSRRAVDQVLKCLRRSGVRKGIAHAFSGSRQQAEAFIGLGFKLGFGGAMTYLGSTRIRRLAATLPLESIVLETDAPDMPPSWLGRRRNAPGELARIAECFSELRGEMLQDVVAETSANSVSVFGAALIRS